MLDCCGGTVILLCSLQSDWESVFVVVLFKCFVSCSVSIIHCIIFYSVNFVHKLPEISPQYLCIALDKGSLTNKRLCRSVCYRMLTKKVKFSHTRYRALGPELILLYRQSARMWLEAIHTSVGCHYFSLGLRLPSQPKSVTTHRPYQIILLCDREAYVCEQLAQGCYLEADWPRFEPATFRIASECSIVKPHRPLRMSTADR